MEKFQFQNALDGDLQVHPARQQIYRRDDARGVLAKDEANKAASGHASCITCWRPSASARRCCCRSCRTPARRSSRRSARTRMSKPGTPPHVWGRLPATVTVHKGEAIFPRIDARRRRWPKLEELQAAAAQDALLARAGNRAACIEEKVDFDTFCKSDLRAVKVKACERGQKVRQASPVHARRRHRHRPPDPLRHRTSSMSRSSSSARRSLRS